MKIIYRYVTGEYIKMLCYTLFAFTAIYLIVDFFDRFDMFVKFKAGAGITIKYFLYKIPFIFYQMIPVAVLLSTLLTIGLLSKNNEVTAMKSSGISIYKLSCPFLIIAFIVTALTFIDSEYVTPYTNMEVINIKNIVKNKQPNYFLKHDKIWYSGKNMIYNIDYFDVKTSELQKVAIFKYDDDFNLQERIDAASAYFKDNVWILRDVYVRRFSYKDGAMQISELIELPDTPAALPDTPDTFKEIRKKAEEMSFGELSSFVKKLKSEGYDATEYEVDMHSKLAIPFISVIMTIIGIPFALQKQRSGSIAIGVGFSIVIGFCYWIVLSFAVSLGHAGVLPPIVAAWISLFIFLLIGGYMFMTIQQ